MFDATELLERVSVLEKENERLKTKLYCANVNFETCNNDLNELGNLVGGTCYEHIYDLIKALVDKQTPKKIIKKYDEDKVHFKMYCPHCDNRWTNMIRNYCDCCGQRIDWSD